jgi:hypothetical protein
MHATRTTHHSKHSLRRRHGNGLLKLVHKLSHLLVNGGVADSGAVAAAAAARRHERPRAVEKLSNGRWSRCHLLGHVDAPQQEVVADADHLPHARLGRVQPARVEVRQRAAGADTCGVAHTRQRPAVVDVRAGAGAVVGASVAQQHRPHAQARLVHAAVDAKLVQERRRRLLRRDSTTTLVR